LNELNPTGKDMLFIDSLYHELFRLPDGGCIQISFPEETVMKRCYYVDDTHTQVGDEVFHICEFAEIMELNGATYQAEPEIMGDEAAWKVGDDLILALQTCDDGYDYTLLNKNCVEIDGGQLDNPDLTMLQARTQILDSFNLGKCDLTAMIYEDVMEQMFEVARQAVVVDDAAGGIISERMVAFMNSPTNAFAILQLKGSEDMLDYRFEPYDRLKRMGLSCDAKNYDFVYSGELHGDKKPTEHLDDLFYVFNFNRPKDYTGHSLSVSDVLILKLNNEISCHYVDRWGFKELPDFIATNPLRNAEMATEDDFGMIDGIINNGQREKPQAERTSVLGTLNDLKKEVQSKKPQAKPHRGVDDAR